MYNRKDSDFEWASMKDHYDFSEGRRGPVVKVPEGKEKITIRLDSDVLNWFRHVVDEAGGGNYQTLINNALREYVGARIQNWKKRCGASCATS
jgi:uncharacterized protein (DUF4415 family)